MFNLDPTKLLIIAVVAVILLGPDKLPQVARQAGAAWRTFNGFRHRMESEVRESIPDLPSSADIARMARSPSTLLNHLSTLSTDEPDQDGTAANGNGSGSGVVANGASENGAAGEPHVTEIAGEGTSADPPGAEPYGEHATTPGPAATPTTRPTDTPTDTPTTRPMSSTPPTPSSATSAASPSSSSGPGVMGDPSLN